jgi:hypothetical protein
MPPRSLALRGDSHGCGPESPLSAPKKQKAEHLARPFDSICDRRLFFETVVRGSVLLAGGEIATFVGLERMHGDVFAFSLAGCFVG